jgi:hypothetical protein
MAILTVAMMCLAIPSTAGAAGCEVIRDAADRADCVARQTARDAARAEVDRQVNGAAPAAGRASGATGRSAAWDRAMHDANGVHADEVFDLRLLAAIGGLIWFTLALRHRRRRARARL